MLEQKIFRKVLRSKLHRATVTHADVNYEGSVTIPPHLLEAAYMRPYEAVCIWNVTTGERFETYTIEGEINSRDIAINGAAAHLAKPGDIVIIACFQFVEDLALVDYEPRVVILGENNEIKSIRAERAGPAL